METNPAAAEKIENFRVSNAGIAAQVMTPTGESQSHNSGTSASTRRAGGASDNRRYGRSGPSSSIHGGAGGQSILGSMAVLEDADLAGMATAVPIRIAVSVMVLFPM